MSSTLIVITDAGTVYQVTLDEEGKNGAEEIPAGSDNAKAAAAMAADGVKCQKIDSESAARGPLEIMGTFVNLPIVC